MTKCQKDSGSMYGNTPVCDRPATVAVTVAPASSYGPITYRSCERHAGTWAVWPDRQTVAPLTEG